MLFDIYVWAAIVCTCVWLAVLRKGSKRAISAEFNSADIQHSFRKSRK